MKTLREVDIQPLDVILFQGVDAVSRAICFMEEKKLGHGGYSHLGLAVHVQSAERLRRRVPRAAWRARSREQRGGPDGALHEQRPDART